MFPFKISPQARFLNLSLQARFLNLNNPLQGSFHKNNYFNSFSIQPKGMGWTPFQSSSYWILYRSSIVIGVFSNPIIKFILKTTFWNFQGVGVAFWNLHFAPHRSCPCKARTAFNKSSITCLNFAISACWPWFLHLHPWPLPRPTIVYDQTLIQSKTAKNYKYNG